MMTNLTLVTPYFAKRSNDGTINYWSQCGKSGQDAADEGKARADDTVASIRSQGHPIILPHIVAAITAGGTFGLMERTFFHRLGEHLLP